MPQFGIDYAWGGPPSPQALRSAGVKFVGRYFSFDPGKNVNAAEYRRLTALGIGCVVVWETTADRALAGEAAGQSDAHNAESQRVRCGMPASQPIHFAVDFEAAGPDVEAYFRGVHAVLKDRAGVYGGYEVVKHLFDTGLVGHGWQTYAWSGGQWDPRALVRQYSNGHVLGGVSCDYDWKLDVPKPPAPKPAYQNVDELHWIKEWDRILPRRTPAAHVRRLFLKRQMVKRKALIWKLAEAHTPPQWSVRNRKARYEALRKRVGG